MANDALIEALKDEKTREQFALLPPDKQAAFVWRATWLQQAHIHQIAPPGDWWSIWLLLAGRGAGKTRTAAEQVAWWAWTEPNTRWLVAAPTSSDVRSTCFEGDSGLMSIIPQSLIQDYNKQHHELRLTNGSLIKGIPASEPERFRGPQFHGAWCCPPHTMIALPCGGELAIEHIKQGDMVMTRHGPRKVLAAGVSGNPSELISIDCGDTQLTTTDDHPILVDNRWIPAGQIKKGDEVWKASFTVASLGTKDQAGIITTNAKDICTDTFGSKLMAQFKKVLLFITPTTKLKTMIFPTWCLCQKKSINDITELEDQTARLKKQQQEKHLNLYGHLKMDVASNAIRSLFLSLRTKLVSFAQGNAWKNGGTIDSTHNKQYVLDAEMSSVNCVDCIAPVHQIAEKNCSRWEFDQLSVLSVERLPNSLTYNLTVEGEHEFIANGIVVHNCDELAAWDYLQDAWDQIMFGVRLGKHTRIICTTTPKPRDLIVELVSREGDDVVLTTASTYSNLANLAPSFQKQILQYEGTKLGRQEIHAEIIDSEESGIVKRDMFKLWPVGKPFPKFEYIIQSYDCAYTEKTINDPTACLVFGMFKPLDGGMCAMLIDAWQDHLQYPDLRPKVIEEYGSVYGEGKEGKRVDLVLVEDKAAGISLIHDLQRAHIPVRAYNPGRADKVQRLSIVANIIACGKVWIPESTLKRGYVRDWAEGFVSQICSFPEAAHDDFVDACVDSSTQVTMANGSSKRIDEVIAGDFVKTPNGSKKVSAVHANGLKELWSVTVGDKTVLATANHKIQTQRGWIRVDRLTQAIDNGYLYQGDTSWHLQRSLGLLLKPLSLMASVITDTLRAATQRTGSILPVLDNAFTVKFGSTTMGQLQKECTSITLMATQPITAYKISNVSGVMHIGIITETHCPKEVERLSTLLTSKESDQKPASGIDQKKEKHGTESTLKTLLQRCGQSLASIRSLNLSVHGAAQHLWQKLNAKSFAVPLVKTQSQSSVLVNQVTNTHTIAQVYDLTVEDEHCYYANGILVHNCSQALRYLRDAGWLDIDGERPEPYDDEDVEDARGNRDRVNPYSA